jgi:hypothetical protein
MITIKTNPKNRNVSLLRRSSLFLSLVTEDFLPFVEEGDTVFILGGKRGGTEADEDDDDTEREDRVDLCTGVEVIVLFGVECREEEEARMIGSNVLIHFFSNFIQIGLRQLLICWCMEIIVKSILKSRVQMVTSTSGKEFLNCHCHHMSFVLCRIFNKFSLFSIRGEF